tara:strand:+ start:4776 stop:5591 length:816 start_codon:yes stop_codon:yes gene_type:complete
VRDGAMQQDVVDKYHCPLDDVERERRFGVMRPENWAGMRGMPSRTVLLYESSREECALTVMGAEDEECRDVLRRCFGLAANKRSCTTRDMVAAVEQEKHYKVLAVERVQSLPQLSMQQQFRKVYELETETETEVYHATTDEGAECISKVGFRAQGGNGELGIGTYCAREGLGAIGAATRAEHGRCQTMVVASCYQGATAEGKEGMWSGAGAGDPQVLTRVNSSGSLLCVTYEAQLRAKYLVRVRNVCGGRGQKKQKRRLSAPPEGVLKKHK